MTSTVTYMVMARPVTNLGHQEGRRVFREGPKFFQLCPIFLNYVQHIFPGGNIFLGELRHPCASLVTGLVMASLRFIVTSQFSFLC